MVTLGFDCDGTVADSWSLMLRLMHKRYGIMATKMNIRSHEVIENEPFKKLARGQAEEVFVDVWKDYRSIRLEHQRIPEIIRWLRNRYDGIYTVTSTVTDNRTILRYHEYTDTGTDGIFWFGNPKEKIKSGVDVMVDDNHEVVEAFASAGKHAVLFAQPWNEDFRKANGSHPNIIIAKNWMEIPGILSEIHYRMSRTDKSIESTMR